MSLLGGPGVSFLTYLWHYTLARLLYNDLVRPLGVAGVGLVLVAVALLLVRTRRQRR